LVYPPKKKKVKKKKGGNEIEKAKETAFRFLSYRPRSIEEVKKKLKEKGFSSLTIKKVTARVKELGYLNDHDYAYAFARSSTENKQWGIVRIYDALVKKGISQEIINQTITKIKKDYDITQTAHRALENKFAIFNPHQRVDKKTRNRAIQYLRRKGFSWDTIFSVIKSTDD
jgi:regulatory protein